MATTISGLLSFRRICAAWRRVTTFTFRGTLPSAHLASVKCAWSGFSWVQRQYATRLHVHANSSGFPRKSVAEVRCEKERTREKKACACSTRERKKSRSPNRLQRAASSTRTRSGLASLPRPRASTRLSTRRSDDSKLSLSKSDTILRIASVVLGSSSKEGSREDHAEHQGSSGGGGMDGPAPVPYSVNSLFLPEPFLRLVVLLSL
mmetsp:Transcript_29923/g.71219  ORF Transcript_29923/g.71219 Transcript_29923/m.71219 type:complete len:206 (-) Transcript_29923:614-1231(-)